MKMAAWRHLIRATSDRIADSESRIERQRRLIADLSRKGDDAASAERELDALMHGHEQLKLSKAAGRLPSDSCPALQFTSHAQTSGLDLATNSGTKSLQLRSLLATRSLVERELPMLVYDLFRPAAYNGGNVRLMLSADAAYWPFQWHPQTRSWVKSDITIARFMTLPRPSSSELAAAGLTFRDVEPA